MRLHLTLSGLLCLLLLPASIMALRIGGQSTSGPAGQSTPDGVIVDTIVIDNRNIYDTDRPPYDNFIFRAANALHWKTRPNVIRREVLLKVGEPFSNALAEETARDLRRRLALYDAWVETEVLSDGRLLVRVVTVDLWSLSAGLSYTREGQQTSWQAGPRERNLVGRNLEVDFRYHFESADEDYARVSYVDKRAYGQPISIAAEYSGNPIDEYLFLGVGHPYYDLSQKWRLTSEMQAGQGRVHVFVDSDTIASYEYDDDYADLGIAYRGGPYTWKYLLAAEYTYRYRNITSYLTLPAADTPEELEQVRAHHPDDSLYHLVSVGLGLSTAAFAKLRRIDAFGNTEDFVLGPAAQMTLGRAFGPSGPVFDVLQLGVSDAGHGHSTLYEASVESQTWYDGSSALRHRLAVAMRLYNRPLSFLTVAAHLDFDQDWSADGSENLVLGGSGGVRGFAKQFRTGNRRAVSGIEARIFPGLDLLSVQFGGVLFVDSGRAWKHGEALGLKGFYTSCGAGLRVSFQRAAKSAVVRLDYSYSQEDGWQFTAGSGPFFGATIGVSFLTTP